MKKKIYISGPITGTDDYMERFAKAEKELQKRGYLVYNPAKIMAEMPPESAYTDYMTVSFALLSICDSIYALRGSGNSKGAMAEYFYAAAMQKEIHKEGCFDGI